MKKYSLKKFIAGGLLCLSVFMLSACGETESAAAKKSADGILVRPDGVEMSIPGTIYGNLKKENKLPLGTYVVCMTAEGCNPVWETVELKTPDQKVIPSERPVPVKASVLIKSVPAGARVLINGENRGVTPCVVSDLDRGSHKLTFCSVGHDDITTELEISNSEPRLIRQVLTRNTGTFTVSFEPADAEIYLNGQRKHGQSPLTLTEPEGTHKLEIRKDKYETVTETITIHRGGEESKEYTLFPMDGSLTVHVAYPSDAVITLDGKKIGNGQLEKLKPGKYKVHVSARGFDPEEQEVEISAAETKDLQIALEANTGKIILPVNEPYVTISLDGRTIGMTQPDPRNPDEAEVFEISGVAVGTYTLSFWHPNTPKTEERKVTLTREKREVRLPRVDVWLPNANVTMQGRVYRNCRITPVEGTDRVKFVYKKINSDGTVGTVTNEVRKSELKINYLGDKSKFAQAEFKSSRVDLLSYQDNQATVTINKIVPGCEIIVNGKSAGIAQSSSMVLRVAPGKYTIRIAHKHGKNVKKPSQNYVERKELTLARGDKHTMSMPGPKLFWIPDTKLILRNGGVLIGQIVSESEDNVMIRVDPKDADARDIPLKDIARKEILD